MIQGVDVSSNNQNALDMDFAAIKAAGRQFVMVRVGYGVENNGVYSGYISKAFAPQITKAQAAGLDTGVYWYSYATTAEQAKIEAQACLKAIAPYKLTYPVAFDQEYQAQLLALTSQQRTDICKAFLEEIENAGYYASLYASKNWFEQYLHDDQLAAYDHWVAQYAPNLTYAKEAGMWQYSGTGKIEGVAGPIDLDVSYYDYPAIIRQAGLNHLDGEKDENQDQDEGDQNEQPSVGEDGDVSQPQEPQVPPEGGDTGSEQPELHPDDMLKQMLLKLLKWVKHLFGGLHQE